MIKLIGFAFFGAVHVHVDKVQIEADDSAIKAASDKNGLEVSPLQNALGYVQIFKEGVPALLQLGAGFVKLGEKKVEAQLRLAERKAETAEMIKEKKDLKALKKSAEIYEKEQVE